MSSATENRYINIYVNGEKVVNSAREISSAYRKVQNELANTEIGSKKYYAALEKVTKLKKHLDDHRNAVNGISKSWQQAKTMIMSVVGGNLITSAFQRLIGIIPSAIQGQAELSDAMADVQKTTGMTAEEVEDLSEKLGKIDTRTAKKDLLDISIVAGQLGIAKEDIYEFTKSIDVLNVALGDEFTGGAAEITDQVGRLRNVLTDTKTADVADDLLHLGNALNVLAAEGSATAPVMVDFSNRIGGIGIPLGLTSSQVLGLSATLQELNVSTERGGTAVTKILQKMTTETKTFAKVAGMDVKEFEELLNKDLMGAFVKVMEGSKKLGTSNTLLSGIIKELELSGAGASEVFAKLGANTDMLKEKVDTATVAIQNTDSAIAEFNTKNNTFGARVDKMKKELYGLFTSKTVKDMVVSLVNMMINLIGWIKRNGDALMVIIKLAGNLLLSFLAYKTFLALGSKINGMWRAMRLELILIKRGSDAASFSFKGLGKAITGIGMSGFLGILTMVVTSLYSFASAADKAAERNELLKASLEKTNEVLGGVDDGVQKRIDAIKKEADLKARKARSKGDESGAKEIEEKTAEEIINVNKNMYHKLHVHAADYAKNIAKIKKQIVELEKEHDTTNISNASRKREIRNQIEDLKNTIAIEEGNKKQVLDLAKKYQDEAKFLQEEGYVAKLEAAQESTVDITAELGNESKAHKKEIDYQLDEYKKMYQQLGELRDDFNNRNDSEEERAKQAIIDKYKSINDGITESMAKLEEGVAAGDPKAIEQYNAFLELKSRMVFQMQDEIDAKLQEMADDFHKENMSKLDEHLDDEAKKELDAAFQKIEIQKMVWDATMSEYERSRNAAESHYNALIALAKQNGMDTVKLEKEKKKALDKIENERVNEAVDKFEKYYSQVSELADAYLQFKAYKAEEELQILDEQHEKDVQRVEERNKSGLLSTEEYEAEKAAVEKRYRDEQAAIKTEQWRRERNAKFASALIETALNVVRAFPNPVLMALAGIVGGAQSALIMAQPVPKFKYGTKRLGGSSHAEGGNDIVDRRTGKVIGNMERNEAIIPGAAVDANGPVVDALLESGRRGGTRINMNRLLGSIPNVNIPRAIGQIKPVVTNSSANLDTSKLEKKVSDMTQMMAMMMAKMQVDKEPKEAILYYKNLKKFESNINRSKELGKFS